MPTEEQKPDKLPSGEAVANTPEESLSDAHTALSSLKEELESDPYLRTKQFFERKGFGYMEDRFFVPLKEPVRTVPLAPNEENFTPEQKEKIIRLFQDFSPNEIRMLLSDVRYVIFENSRQSPERMEKFVSNVKKIKDSYFRLRKQVPIDDNEPGGAFYTDFYISVLYAPDLADKIMSFCNFDVERVKNVFGSYIDCLLGLIQSGGNEDLLMRIIEGFENKREAETVASLYPTFGADKRFGIFFSRHKRLIPADSTVELSQTFDKEKNIYEAGKRVSEFLRDLKPIDGLTFSSRKNDPSALNINGILVIYINHGGDIDLDEFMSKPEAEMLQSIGITNLSDFNEANGPKLLSLLEEYKFRHESEEKLEGYKQPNTPSFRERCFIHMRDWASCIHFSKDKIHSVFGVHGVEAIFSFDANTGKITRITPELRQLFIDSGISTIKEFIDKFDAIMPKVEAALDNISEEYFKRLRLWKEKTDALEREVSPKVEILKAKLKPVKVKLSRSSNVNDIYMGLSFSTDFCVLAGKITEGGKYKFSGAVYYAHPKDFDDTSPEGWRRYPEKYGRDFEAKFADKFHSLDELIKNADSINRWFQLAALSYEQDKLQQEKEAKELGELSVFLWKKLDAYRKHFNVRGVDRNNETGKPFILANEGRNSSMYDSFYIWMDKGKFIIGGYELSTGKVKTKEELADYLIERARIAIGRNLVEGFFRKEGLPKLADAFKGKYDEKELINRLSEGPENFVEFLYVEYTEKQPSNFKLFDFLIDDFYFERLNPKKQRKFLEIAPAAFEDDGKTLDLEMPDKLEEALKKSKSLLAAISKLDDLDIKNMKALTDAYLKNLSPAFCTFVLMTENLNVKNEYFKKQLIRKAEKNLGGLKFLEYKKLDRVGFINNLLSTDSLQAFSADKTGMGKFLEGIYFENFNALLVILDKTKKFPEFHSLFVAKSMDYLEDGGYRVNKPFEAEILLNLVADYPDKQAGVLQHIIGSNIVLEGDLMDKINALVQKNPALREVLMPYLRYSENALLSYLKCCGTDFDLEEIIKDIENYEFVFESEFSTRQLFEATAEKFPAHFERLYKLAIKENEKSNVWLVGLIAHYYFQNKDNPKLKELREALPEAKRVFFDIQIKKVALAKKIGDQYKVRPRSYLGLLDKIGTTQRIEKEFLERVRDAANFVNAKIAAKQWGFKVSQEEIVTTFMTEGGVLNLRANVENFNGFGSLGLDTYGSLLDNENLRFLSFSELLDLKTSFYTNEKGERYKTFDELDLRQAVYAVAGMYAFNKLMLARNLKARGMNINALTPEQQFFWTTVYFNAGPGGGKKLFEKEGLQYADKPWHRKDENAKYNRVPKYNATWRTASFKLIREIGVLKNNI